MSNYQKHSNEPQESFDLLLVIKQIVSRWYLFMFTVPLFLGLAWYKNTQSVPLYSVSSRIIIEVQKDRVIYNEDMTSGLSALFRSKTVENEIEVLHSRDLISRTLDSLDFLVSYYPSTAPGVELLQNEVPFEIRADHSEADKLMGKPIEIEFTGEYSFDLSFDEKPLGAFQMGQIIELNDFHFIVDQRAGDYDMSSIREPIICYINSERDVVNQYLRKLQVMESDKDTDAILLTMDDPNEERGLMFIDKLLECYFVKILEDRKRVAETNFEFIDARLRQNFGYLDSLEYAIDNFKQERQITDLTMESRYILEGIKKFEIELSDALTQQRIVNDLVNKALSDPRGEMDLSIPNTMLGVTDPLLNRLIADLSTKQYKLRTLSKTVKKDNPLYQELRAEIDDLRSSVMVDLLNLQDNMVTTVEVIERQIEDYKGKLSAIGTDEKGLAAMERVRNNKEELYVFLLKKREEAAMVLASEMMDTWVIEKPYVSNFYYNPKRSIVLLIGLFLGLFFPVTGVLLWIMLDGKIRGERDVKRIIDLPVIAQIAAGKSNRAAIAALNHFQAEDFKQLSFNLRFVTNPYQVVMVGSMSGGDGKTFSAAHLARTQAALGKKTCLIELDLRRPSLDAVYVNQDKKHLVDFLMGDANLEDILLKSDDPDGCDVIRGGRCPIDPTRLLMSTELDSLIADLKRKYDVVVMDTAPIGAVTDALVCARFADINLMVIRQDHTKKERITELRDIILNKRLAHVAIVLNGVTQEQGDKYYVDMGREQSLLARMGATIAGLFKKKAYSFGEQREK